MKIYIWDDDQEKGPYTKEEAFSLLRNGSLTKETWARWEDQTDWSSLNDILPQGQQGFFSLEQIERQQAEMSSAPVTVPELASPPQRIEAPSAPPKKNRGKLLITGTAILMVFSAVSFFYVRHAKEGSLASNASKEPAIGEPTPVTARPPTHRENKPLPGTKSPGATDSIARIEPKEAMVAAENPPAQLNPAPSASPAIEAEKSLPPSVVSEKVPVVEAPSAPISSPATDPAPAQQTVKSPFEMAYVSEVELLRTLNDRFSYSPFANRVTPPKQKLKVFQGSFTLDTSFKMNPKIEVIYAIPLNPNGSPGPNADSIVMKSNWPGGMEPFEEVVDSNGKKTWKKRDFPTDLLSYCQSFGCTVFMPLMHTPRKIWSDPAECYFLGGKEWVDLVFRAQQEIVKKYRLKPRKLILCGYSLGATFVQRVAAAHPEKVAAVAPFGAPDIAIPNPDVPSDTVWFLGINRGDSMRSSYSQLFNVLMEQKKTVIFSIFPPNFGSRRGDDKLNYHSESGLVNKAKFEFIRGIIEKQTPNGGNAPKKWSYVRDRANPVGIFSTTSAKAKSIPEERREYLPSKGLVDFLQSLPAPMQNVTLSNPSGGKNIECLVGLPSLGKPAGIAIYLHTPELADIPRFIDNVYFLTGKGLLVITPKIRSLNDESLQVIAHFIKKTRFLQSLPLAYIGVGDANKIMWQSIASLKVPPPSALATIGFQATDGFSQDKLPVGGGVKCPTLFIYDEKPLTKVSSVEEVRQSLNVIRSVKEYVEACKSKGQFARVAIIPASAQGTTKAPINDQQAINYAGDFVFKAATQQLSSVQLP